MNVKGFVTRYRFPVYLTVRGSVVFNYSITFSFEQNCPEIEHQIKLYQVDLRENHL